MEVNDLTEEKSERAVHEKPGKDQEEENHEMESNEHLDERKPTYAREV